ncbi:MAG: hypothetical protein P1P64_04290 [Treponemataceae bacterium]
MKDLLDLFRDNGKIGKRRHSRKFGWPLKGRKEKIYMKVGRDRWVIKYSYRKDLGCIIDLEY